MKQQGSIPKSELAQFCRAQGVRRLSISGSALCFGSALRADFAPELGPATPPEPGLPPEAE